MRVELITIGDELLLGFTADTNALFLARELGELGIAMSRRTTVGDDAGEITAAVSEALARADGVITTGGLGPTSDDVTKPAVAAAFGRKLRRDAAVVANLEALWKSRGRSGPLPASNLSQALLPEGARILPNANGTAPGVWIERDDGAWAAMLPGVPRELREMYRSALRPILAQRSSGAAVIRSRTIRTTGVAESQLPDLLGELAAGAPGVALAYLPGVDGVDLRLTVRGHPPAEADKLLADAGGAVRAKLGVFAYADGETDLAHVVVRMCKERNLSIAVAESCTGGLLGARVTSVAGSSDVFRGGTIAYDNAVKVGDLAVAPALIEEHGAVSEPVVNAMAAGARLRFAADLAVAITGVAGPGGGSREKPVGTVWIALADARGAAARQLRLFGDRGEIRHRAVQAALDAVRRKLVSV